MCASENIKVDCPGCKSTLTIPNTPDVGGKMLTCPVCGMRAKVSVYQQFSIGKKQENNDATEVSFEDKNCVVGSLYVGKTEFPLKTGRNTIGRYAKNTGTADVQLMNEDGSVDKFMSRCIAVITAKEKNHGVEHLLESFNQKYIIQLNRKPIVFGDVVSLQFGDKLTLGHTTILFQRPGYFEEETISE